MAPPVRSVFLTINQPQTNQNLVTYGSMVHPWAQVTVLDASEGDSNIVDLCKFDLDPTNGGYPSDVSQSADMRSAYYRAIIDTGPNAAQLDNLTRLIKQLGPPKVLMKNNQLSGGENYESGLVNLFQLTHIDKDHCGQAVKLLASVQEDKDLWRSFRKTKVMYHEPPRLNPTFVLRIPPNGPGSQSQKKTATYFDCHVDEQGWLETIKKMNYRLRYKWFWQPLLDVVEDVYGDNWQALDTILDEYAKINLTYQQFTAKRPKGNKDGNQRPNCLAMQCEVSLQNFGTEEKSTFWKPVLAQYQSKPEKYKNTPVKWLVVQKFGLNPVPNNDNAYILFKLTKGSSKPKHTPYRGVKIFNGLRDQTKAMNEYYQLQVKAVPGSVPTKPWFDSLDQAAHQGKFDLAVSQGWQCTVVGPTENVYSELIEEMIKKNYKASKTPNDPDDPDVGTKYGPFEYKDSPETIVLTKGSGADNIANRASIVTMFRRYITFNNGPRLQSVFDMLFTGDAYDRDCDVRDTVAAFEGVNLTQRVDVLKVPHHGSKTTSDTRFYQNFRAQVYLICAQQKNHGNPGLSTLEAIVKGFEEPPSNYKTPPIEPRHVIFFSSPGIMDDIEPSKGPKLKSHLYQLLTGPFRPNYDTTKPKIYNYKCFRLRKGKNKEQLTAGRIVFGGDDNFELAMQFTVTTDETKFADLNINDWVEIQTAPW